MSDIINFSKFIGVKKELPKFNKKEIYEDFFISGEDNSDVDNTIDDPDEPDVRKDRVDIHKEETAQNVEESFDEENLDNLINEQIERIRNSKNIDYQESSSNSVSDSDVYPLYIDKNENFNCEIEIEGASLKNTQVRLVVEGGDWNLFFNGEIDHSGRVNIPIRKLNILEEGTRGSIKMEVIADGSVFTPWEQDFIAKRAKKVSVTFNENKKIKQKNDTDVKVSLKIGRP